MTPPSAPPPPADGLLAAGRRNLRALAHAVSHPSHPPTPLFADAPKRWQRLLPYVVVVALVATFLPLTITVLTDYGMSGGLAGAIAAVQTVPLLMIAHRPLQAWWIILPADVVGGLFALGGPASQSSWPWTPSVIVAYLFLMLALALRETRQTLIGVWLVTGAAGAVLGRLFPGESDGTNVLLLVLSAVVLVIGGALRERGEAQRRLVEQETISEAERAHRTLLEERTRIARELHDVVAHHMSVITVQADSAPYRVGGLPPEAQAEFASIAASARESLTEMRRLLSVLRSEDATGERAPQPGLDRLQQLVEATVRAGVPAGLSLTAGLAEPGRLPQTIDLSAYRIVQEALANVVRHAPGADTRVSVSSDGTHLTVLVVNGPPAGPASPVEAGGAGGHGLVGMRERVRLTGGTLDTGPLPDGGFRVAARLPLGTKEPVSP
ncbi:sensor histidine kinase [Streptomyces agglomeratus]|uniref:sensor histidine kinase n=1 Tax=Streptomyces agglomeratus TaxID=285458 RepID=UPI000853F21B|nr:histidine kinase [Streptomyces agglomeratus]OEJ51444.1 two-component sensor histidine kinase [Streptomyces agglomeratus]